MNYSIKHIADEIRAAREKKGLSQRALGAKIGIPQSHISRIEKGAVDLQASSLIEISRALDLELMMVPRTLVPAVQGLKRKSWGQGLFPSERISETTAKDLDKILKNAKLVARRFSQTKALENLVPIIKNLQQLRPTQAQARQIQKLLDQLNPAMEKLKSIQRIQEGIKQAPRQKEFDQHLNQISQVNRRLIYLRNMISHGLNERESVPLPAYRLDEGGTDE